MCLPMILMFVLFYFIAIRPQRKKQQELAAQIAALKGGDHIVTTGGLYGVVSSLQEKTLTLKIADNVKIKLDKAAVAASVDHGGVFAALVARDNMAGAQFHPEKSQANGLKLLSNFLEWKP